MIEKFLRKAIIADANIHKASLFWHDIFTKIAQNKRLST